LILVSILILLVFFEKVNTFILEGHRSAKFQLRCATAAFVH